MLGGGGSGEEATSWKCNFWSCFAVPFGSESTGQLGNCRVVGIKVYICIEAPTSGYKAAASQLRMRGRSGAGGQSL